MNAGSEALNILPETQKRVIPYCKIAFGFVASTIELLGLGGVRRGMLPTFPKQQGLVSLILPTFPRLWLPDSVTDLAIQSGWCTRVDLVVGIYPLSKHSGKNPAVVWGVIL